MKFHCPSPSTAVNPVEEIDYGKVNRRELATVALAGRPDLAEQMLLYEIQGQDRRYVINGLWAVGVNGWLDARPGSLVALCVQRTSSFHTLPPTWGTAFTSHLAAARVGAAPQLGTKPSDLTLPPP